MSRAPQLPGGDVEEVGTPRLPVERPGGLQVEVGDGLAAGALGHGQLELAVLVTVLQNIELHTDHYKQ